MQPLSTAGRSVRAVSRASRKLAKLYNDTNQGSLSLACSARRIHASASYLEKSSATEHSGGVMGKLQEELNKTLEQDAELKKAFNASSAAEANATSNAADSEAGASSADSSSSAKAEPEAPKQRGALSRMWDDAKDVLAVTFGFERRRDLAAEYASGERPYPWVTYIEPGTEKRLYRNTESGVVTEIQPPDWERFATAANELTADTEASAVTTVRTEASKWEKTLEAVTSAPLVGAILEGVSAAGEAVAASPVGVKAKELKTRVDDKIEDARESWETSQHPLVVNASYMVDNMMAETEQGRAVKQIADMDASFDQYQFVVDMQEKLMPQLAKAFFQLDMPVLTRLCRESALAQMKAVSAARAIEGLTHDGIILNVSKCEMTAARTLEQAEGGGTLPVILTTAQVQYIHTVRNKKGEIVEGSESEIRAAFFILAVTREYDPATGALGWRVVELTMQGAMQYL